MYHKPKVSIVIPCYNSENYLQKAVDSALNQSLQELQIILVDDGSTDKTPVLLQQYKMQDNRVEVITHPENRGLGPARNSGIKIAKGEYLFFLDSDDYIHPNGLEVLYEYANSGQLDILQAQYIVHKDGKKKVMPPDLVPLPHPVSGIQYFNLGFFIAPQAWSKLWRTDFIKKNHLKFSLGFYEDIVMVYDAIIMAARINNIPFASYHYIIRSGSITQRPLTFKHINDYKRQLMNLQHLFLRPELTGKNSAFVAGFFLYLKELSIMALKNGDPEIINETKEFVSQMGYKYGKFLRRNSLLSFPKRFLLKRSPFLFAVLKKAYYDKIKKADI